MLLHMFNKIRKTISQYNMFSERDSVLVGLSGGPDSVCLLHILKEYGLKLYIAHLNHGLRGKESDEDERFCKELGRKLGISVYAKKVKIGKGEDAARNARYKFLEDTAHKIGATKIALGHNADDEAETVLMRLLRGAGVRGLSGIPPVRRLGDLVIVRPLINVWRKEIMDYLGKRNITYREDSTNKQLDFFRNRIRYELIPFLTKYNPNIKNILHNTGKNMAMVNEYLDSVVNKELQGNEIKIKRLKRLHPIIKQGLVRRVAESLEPGLVLESIQVDNILELTSEIKGSKSIVLPKGIKVIREYDKLFFCRNEKGKGDFEIELPIPGKVKIGEYNILTDSKLCKRVGKKQCPGGRSVKGGGKIRRNLLEVYLDYDRMARPLIIRNRKPGDVFQPIGFKGKKKVKDIFIDEKVPERYRDIIPIFVSGRDICWIPGYRIGEKFKIVPETKNILEIKVMGVDKLWQIQMRE